MRRISKFLVGTTAALGGVYGVVVTTKVGLTYRYKVTTSSQNPRDFNESYAVTKHANPRGHVAFNHTLSVTVRIPGEGRGRAAKALTDERLLVRMVKGYYGGWVIAPERWAFAAVGADIVNFEGVPKPKNIWSPASSLQESLPPLHHILIGAFQVLDKHIVGNAQGKSDVDSKPPPLGLEGMHAAVSSTGPQSALTTTTSYVDFGFGDNKGTFAGINRFAVTSVPDDDDDDGTNTTTTTTRSTGTEKETAAAHEKKDGRLVRLTFSAVACNPSQEGITTSKWILEMHKIYVALLFREAVGRVLADC